MGRKFRNSIAGTLSYSGAIVFLLWLFGIGTHAHGSGEIRLSWVEDDGTDLSLDWRVAHEWTWRDGQYGLQIQMEVREDLADRILKDSKGDASLLIFRRQTFGTSSGFVAKKGHSILVSYLKSPVQWIPMVPDPIDNRVRALRIDVSNVRGSIHTHASCRERGVTLRDGVAGQKRPFFLSIHCTEERKSGDVGIRVLTAENSVLRLRPEGPARLGSGNVIRFNGSGEAGVMARDIAHVEVTDSQTQAMSSYRIVREKKSISTVSNAVLRDRRHESKFGVAIETSLHQFNGFGKTWAPQAEPGVAFRWLKSPVGNGTRVRLEAGIPVSHIRFQGRDKSSTRLGWARVLMETPFSNRDELKKIFGVQIHRLEMSDATPTWASPVFGVLVQGIKGSSIDWSVMASPISIGAGSSDIGRARLSVEVESAIQLERKRRFVVYGGAFQVATLGRGHGHLRGAGAQLGLRGEF